MPTFSLPKAIDGTFIQSAEFQGQAILVTFFATWCPPCRQEIPALKALQEKYSKQKFTVLALSIDKKGPSVVNKLIEIENINYPVLMADKVTAQKFGEIIGIPKFFLINKNGYIIKDYPPGFVSPSLLEKDIKSVL